MAPENQSRKSNKVFVFDMARCRSHLFFRYLSTHPDLEGAYHPFMDAFLFGPERITKKTRNSGARKTEDVGTTTFDQAEAALLQRATQACAKGRILFANEHCQMLVKQDITFSIIREPSPTPFPPNPTVIPNSLFESILTIFVIRNPIHVIPSIYASSIDTMGLSPSDEDWILLTSALIQRLLFDHFRKALDHIPIVVDGDDILWRTEEMSKGVCQYLDIDPGSLSETWDPLPLELQHPSSLIRAFTTTINTSTGIERPPGGPPLKLSLDDAVSQWTKLYGEDIARQLRARVEDNMPHYLHMSQFKV